MQFDQTIIEVIDPYLMGVLISMGIGLILGLEREYDKIKDEKGFAGIRTFPIVTILGYVLGNLTEIFTPWLLIVSLGSFILFLSVGHVVKTRVDSPLGMTTNIALIITFVLGIMVSEELYRHSIATAVIVVTLLSLKTTFKSLIENITSAELFAFIKFVVIALLILPFLPDQNYGLDNLLNPYEIGLIVVIVSFLNFIGYFLVKFVGSRKGILLTAILGGLISSTAVTWNYASKSKENPELSREYGAGIIIASAIMFPRLALLAAIFNTSILIYLAVPLSVLTFICLIPAILFIKKDSGKTATEIDMGNPLNILNALTFAVIYVAILYAVHYGNSYFGESGLYYSALIAGLADTTAITISLAKFATDTASTRLAAMVIVAATLSNTVVKLGIVATRGSRATARLVGTVFGAVIAIGILFIFIEN